MKVANFITHALIFLAAWIGLATWSWGLAQTFSNCRLMPWVTPIVGHTPSAVVFATGAAVAILGAFLAAMVLLVVLIALEAIVHFVLKPPSASQS